MLREQRKLFNKIRRNALIYVRYEHFRLFGSVLCSTQNNEYYPNTLFTPYPKYQAPPRIQGRHHKPYEKPEDLVTSDLTSIR